MIQSHCLVIVQDTNLLGNIMQVLDNPESIQMYRLLTMYQMLKLEIKGMKHSRGSVYALIKKEFGLKGTKQNVLEQFGKLIGKGE